MARKASISGLVVFFVGIVLLVVTFIVALLAFINPDRMGGFGDLIPAPEEDWEGVVKALGYLVAIGLLTVLGCAAGRIAALGIRMFKAQPSSETDEKAQPSSETDEKAQPSSVPTEQVVPSSQTDQEAQPTEPKHRPGR